MTQPIPVQLADNRSPGQIIFYNLWVLVDRYVLDPWVAMLIIGAAHHWWAWVPNISFPRTWLLLLLVRIFITPPLTMFDMGKYRWES